MEAVAFFESRGAGRVTAIIGAMPLAISQGQLGAPPTILRRRPWTRKDYEVLESTGAFEGQRYELIEGELIDKMSELSDLMLLHVSFDRLKVVEQ